MRIFYPYNEILPRRKAHDVFIFQECSVLASLGFDVTLLCGKGSQENEKLLAHYHAGHPFHIERLPIVRKNNPFNISWGLPFSFFCQKEIEKKSPEIVILSVLKSAAYHLKRKHKKAFYIYEVHEVSCYDGIVSKRFEFERETLSCADLLTVTTAALKEILQRPPYGLKNRIEVVPLGVSAEMLPPSYAKKPFVLFYVGQLYEEQGVSLLLEAIEHVPEIHLKIVGGKEEEIANLKKKTTKVEFLGFRSPSDLEKILKEGHAFIAPFLKKGRMPYVAHTKLLEYRRWGKPIIAPNLPVVHEHFPEAKGVIAFESGDVKSLISALRRLINDHARLQEEILELEDLGSWRARGREYQKIIKGFYPLVREK